MKPVIIGYIVSGPGGPLELCTSEHYPVHGVLQYGKDATLFPSRKRILTAIARTIRWYLDDKVSDRQKWPFESQLSKNRSYRILPVRRVQP